MTIGSTTYHLDPAFKVSEPVTGISLTNATGFSLSGLLNAAGGTDTGNYVTNLNEASIRATLTGYTTNLLNYLQNNAPNASVQQVLGGWQIVPATNTVLSQSLLFDEDSIDLPIVGWTYEPTNLMTSFSIAFASTNYQWWMPQLEGQRISLTYSNNGVAQLWQDDTLLIQKSTATSDTNFVLTINHPFGTWDYTNNALIDTGLDDQSTTNACQRTSSTYVMAYAFEPDWGWLHKRQNQLDAYRMSGLTNGSRQVVSETLNILGLSWVSKRQMLTRFWHRKCQCCHKTITPLEGLARRAQDFSLIFTKLQATSLILALTMPSARTTASGNLIWQPIFPAPWNRASLNNFSQPTQELQPSRCWKLPIQIIRRFFWQASPIGRRGRIYKISWLVTIQQRRRISRCEEKDGSIGNICYSRP